MENVRQVITSKGWHEWCAFLESLGYSNYCEILNACDYEIPQHRERAFMISILGEYSYSFPKKNLLKLRLKDMLEKEVDEKYYLSPKMIKYISSTGTKNFKNSDCKINLDIARPLTTSQNKREGTTNYIGENLPNNFDLNRADELLLCENGELDDKKFPCGCDSSLYNPKVREISNCITSRIDAGIQNKQQIGMCVIEDYKMSKHLKETLEKNNDIEDGDYLDCYNRSIKKDGITGVIHTRISASNDTFVVVKDKIIIMGGKVIIPEATKKGYAIAEDGDGIYINRPHQKRGVVQKGKIQTIKTSVEDIAVVENKPILLGGIGEKDSNNNTQWKQQNRIYSSDSCSIAVTSTFQPYYYYYLRIRKLTPKECFRLMGFDDEDFEKAEKVNSNAQLYKQAGNSIVVNVLCYIFKELL